MKVNVKEYLKKDRHSVIREKLINYHFFYEVKLAGARNDNDIQISFPEIDKEGYDVVLDDGDSIRVIQIKTVLSDARTSRWKVQKQLLRPNFNNLAILGFDKNKSHSWGHQGGIVLIEVEANQQTIKTFSYYYCDIFTLKAFECGLITYKLKANQNAVLSVIKELQPDTKYNRYDGNNYVALPRSAFLKVNNVDGLLALANLSSVKPDYAYWRMHYEAYLSKAPNERIPNDRNRIINLLKGLIVVDSSKLIIE